MNEVPFVMPALRFGGAERVTSVLANEWVKQGVNVRILLVESDAVSYTHLTLPTICSV